MNHRSTRSSPLPVPSLEKKHLKFYHRQDIHPKPSLCAVLELISVNVKTRKPPSSPHDSRWVHTNTFISAVDKLRRSVVLTKVQLQTELLLNSFGRTAQKTVSLSGSSTGLPPSGAEPTPVLSYRSCPVSPHTKFLLQLVSRPAPETRLAPASLYSPRDTVKVNVSR